MFELKGRRIWVAGSHGMVGSALTRRLKEEKCDLLRDPARADLDLRNQASVTDWMRDHKPDVVFLAAARVGGIMDNAAHPADFIADNLQIETNIITSAAKLNVKRLVFLGSSCIYPRDAAQPLKETCLGTGALEETNRAYAMAKLAGIELIRSYRTQYDCNYLSVLPCNLYGPGDRFDAERSHVIPALMLKIRQAMEDEAPGISVWGTGKALREFMHVDDMADACVHLAKTYTREGPVNIGTGQDISIAQLVLMMTRIAGYKGDITFDKTRPDGTPRKVLDVSRLSASSWRPKISLEQGLQSTWSWYLQQALAPSQALPPSLLPSAQVLPLPQAFLQVSKRA